LHSLKLAFTKYKVFLLGMLAHLGIWGPFAISALDSAAFGIPMDPVMVGYVWKDREHLGLVVFYCLAAAVGSALGSLVPYWIGRAGEELILLKRIDHKRLQELRDKFENQEFFFLMIPSMLPPPTPFKLFVLCAGAFEMRIPLFLLAIFLGRLVRFALVAFLTIRFGQEIATVVGVTLRQHLPLLFAIIAAVVAAYLFIRFRRKRSATVVA
jgi:membrane protein YqaA with SNARE-associated domain